MTTCEVIICEMGREKFGKRKILLSNQFPLVQRLGELVEFRLTQAVGFMATKHPRQTASRPSIGRLHCTLIIPCSEVYSKAFYSKLDKSIVRLEFLLFSFVPPNLS